MPRFLLRIDADAILIVEAPNTGKVQNTIRALQCFAEAFDLRTSHAAMGFANDTHQELALLYDPRLLKVRHDPGGSPMTRPVLTREFRIDLDVDATEDRVQFSKPPMELAVEIPSGQIVPSDRGPSEIQSPAWGRIAG